MAERKISDEGEIVLAAMDRHLDHILTHDCGECRDGYETYMRAITNWVGSFDKDKPTADDIFGIKKKRKENGDGR